MTYHWGPPNRTQIDQIEKERGTDAEKKTFNIKHSMAMKEYLSFDGQIKMKFKERVLSLSSNDTDGCV